MKGDDIELGMGRGISRRDFIYGASALAGLGVAAAAGGVFGQTSGASAQQSASSAAVNYPPLRNGMRGFHPGSFEPVHGMAWNGQTPPAAEDTGEIYDLVVVGGGLSGLAAAYYYRKKAGPNARVLIIVTRSATSSSTKVEDW